MPSISIKPYQENEEFPKRKQILKWRIEDRCTSLNVQNCQRETRSGPFRTIKRSKNDVTTILTGHVTKTCESFGAGHLEGEGRTLRHHPHLSTPTRIAEKNVSLISNGIKPILNDHRNILCNFENSTMKCHRTSDIPCLNVAYKNNSSDGDNTKRSEIKATEVTHEQSVKYEGNRRIKRKTVKTSEYSHIKTKISNTEKVDGSLNVGIVNGCEGLTSDECYEWTKLNDLRNKKDRVVEYNQNSRNLNGEPDEKLLHRKSKHKKELSTRESAWYRKGHTKESLLDEAIKTKSTGSTSNTLSSLESDRFANHKHIINVNVSSSDVSIDSPSTSNEKEQWPDVKCKMRILQKKEKRSASPTAIIRIKKLENGTQSSSSEQEMSYTSPKPQATFKIRKRQEQSSFEEGSFNGSKFLTSEKYKAETYENSNSPTVTFRIKKPTLSDNNYRNFSNSDYSTSDETSTLSSFSMKSTEDYFVSETKSARTNHVRTNQFPVKIPQSENGRQYKESSIEKNYNTENYSTHSSKEEEIKYQKNPIEIQFRIKCYEEESSKNSKNTEKTTNKEYSKSSDIFNSSDSSMESEKTSSKRILRHFSNENKGDNKEFKTFSDEKEIYSEARKNEIFEAFRGTSEIMGCSSRPLKSRERASLICEEKLKTNPRETNFSANSRFEFGLNRFNKLKLDLYDSSSYERNSERESKTIKNERSEGEKYEIKPEKVSNLTTYKETLSLPEETESYVFNITRSDSKEAYESSQDDKLNVDKYSQKYYMRKLYPDDYQEKFKFKNEKTKHIHSKPIEVDKSEIKPTEIRKSSDTERYKIDIQQFEKDTDTSTKSKEISKVQEKEYSSQLLYQKYDIPKLHSFKLDKDRKYKENETFKTRKHENFEGLNKEILLSNTYFNTKSSQTDTGYWNKREVCTENNTLTEFNSCLETLEEKNNMYRKKFSQLGVNSVIPPKLPNEKENRKTQEKHSTSINYKSSDSDNSKKPRSNTLEIYQDLKSYKILDDLQKEQHNGSKKTSSFCNNIEWHSINREKDTSLPSVCDKRFTTEIFTQKVISGGIEVDKIDKLKDFEEKKAENRYKTSLEHFTYQKPEHRYKTSLENFTYRRKEDDELYTDTLTRQLEKNRRENEEDKINIRKIVSDEKHLSQMSTHLASSKLIIDGESCKETELNKRSSTFKTYNTQDLTKKKVEPLCPKEICSVQVQLSPKGFRIKNWREELIIHRMLFTSVMHRERALYDITNSKNVITEKRFYVDAVGDVRNTYKMTAFEKEKSDTTVGKLSSVCQNNYRDISSMRQRKGEILKSEKNKAAKRRATTLFIVWIPDYKTNGFENLNLQSELTTRFDYDVNCVREVNTIHVENLVWTPLSEECKCSAVSALLRSEWSTGGCSMSREEKVPTLLTLVQPMTSFNLSCTENSLTKYTSSQNLPPVVISSVTIPTTVRSVKVKERVPGLLPINVLQNPRRQHQSLPVLCYHRQIRRSKWFF